MHSQGRTSLPPTPYLTQGALSPMQALFHLLSPWKLWPGLELLMRRLIVLHFKNFYGRYLFVYQFENIII